MNINLKKLLLPGALFLLALGASPGAFADKQYVRNGQEAPPSATRGHFKSRLTVNQRQTDNSNLFVRSERKNVVAPATSKLKKATASADNVFAGVVYEISNFKLGYGVLNPTTAAWSQKMAKGVSVQSIGFNEDLNEVYTLEYNIYPDHVEDISANVYDYNTGEKKNTLEITTNEVFNLFPQYSAYVPSENAFYGYGNAGWVKWDMTTMTGTLLKSYTDQEAQRNFTPSLCYNYSSDTLVGIAFGSNSADVVSINMSTGRPQNIGEINVGSSYIGGICFDAVNNRYLWNPNDDYSSEIVAVDATTFEASKLSKLSSPAELGCLFLPEIEVPAGADAPATPEFIGSSFPNAGMTGEITFRLPSKLNNGNAISGNVGYTVSVSGKVVATGNGAAGSEVTVKIDDSAPVSEGLNSFKIVAEVYGNKSNTCSANVWIGYDVPLAPTNVKLTPTQVTWDAVTEGAHGGYIDTESLYYSVYLNGEEIDPYVTGTTSSSGLSLTSPLDSYLATVTATNHGLTSAPGKSNDLTFGEPQGEPYYIEPTREEFEKCVIFNVNNDKDFSGADRTWRFDEYSGFGNAFTCSDSYSEVSDDWIFLPIVNIKNTNNYHRFSMRAWSGSSWSPDKLEVYLCDSPDPNTYNRTTIWSPLEVDCDMYDPKIYSKLFSISNPGNYYIGIRNITANGYYMVYVNDIKLEVTELDTFSAAAVTDLTATPAENGELSATISFKMPQYSIGGYSLPSEMTATVVSPVETITVTGAPGSEQSVEIKTVQSTEEEMNNITVTTYASGKVGDSASVQVYTGVVVAAAPTNIRMDVDTNNMGGVLRWDAPDKALKVYDGYIGDTFEYTVCEMRHINNEDMWVPIMNVGSATEYTISIPAGTEQKAVGFGVVASNAAGCGAQLIMDRYYHTYDDAIAGRNLVLGKLYDLPAMEEITVQNVFDKSLAYNPMSYDLIVAGGGYLATPSLIDNSTYPLDSYESPSGAAMLVQWNPGRGSGPAKADITLPKFSLKGKNKVAFTPCFYLNSIKNVEVGVLAYGQENVEMIADFGSVIGGETSGWNEMQIVLPDKYIDSPWVELHIYPTFMAYEQMQFLLSGYKLLSQVPYDLGAISIDAPEEAVQGSTFEVKASAMNYGTQEIRSFTATLYANGEEVASQTGSNVKSLANADVTFECTMPAIATEDVVYTVTFTCDGDADLTNNTTSEVTVAPEASNLPKASELQAMLDEKGVVLTWLEPESTTVPGPAVTEDFEDAESFSNQYGDWIFVDRDDTPIGGIIGVDIPNITPDETKASFMIWDNDVLNNIGTQSHSGTKSLFAMFSYDYGLSDDWAISPELSGDAQTISFYAKSYNDGDEAHTIQVWYSNGSVDTADFEQVELEGPNPVPTQWTRYKATLPAGAKRFAIRNYTEEGFILLVDDVTYVPAGTPSVDLAFKGYEVYRDGEKITTEPVATTAYQDMNVADEVSYTYLVTTVYDKGESGPTNPATIKFSGIDPIKGDGIITSGQGYIRLSGFDGESFVISAPDGKVMASGKAQSVTTVKVSAGIYVVKVGNKVAKVIVK